MCYNYNNIFFFCQAVMSGKKMLIFDEPTSGLDFRHMCQVEKMMKRLAEEKLYGLLCAILENCFLKVNYLF